MSAEEFQGFIAQLRRLVNDHIMPCHTWYSKHIWFPRVMFQAGGMVVLVGSLTLPVIVTSTTLPNREMILTVISLSVAIVTSSNAFFRWDTTWRGRTRAGHALQGLLANWEYDLAAAAISATPQQAALASTEKLFKEAYALVGAETEEFFASLHWPEAARPIGA